MKKIFLTTLALATLCACVKDEVYVSPEGPTPPPEVPQTLVINEVSPATKKIEFYNTGSQAIELGGCSVVKDGTDSWEMPNVSLNAGAVIVFTAKSASPTDGPAFGMSATKGFKLELFNKKGESIDVLDNSKGSEKFYSFIDEAESTETLGRETDGAAQWVIFSAGTIGAANAGGTKLMNWGEAPPEPEGGVVLNELYGAASNDAEKFIELYNSSSKEIVIKGYTLSKDGSTCWTAPDGAKIAPKSWFAIVGAKGTTPDGFSSGFSAKKSVQVILFNEKGEQIDVFTRGEEETGWGNQALDAVKGSWSRIPDGKGKFMITETVTVGAANATEGTEDPTVKQ